MRVFKNNINKVVSLALIFLCCAIQGTRAQGIQFMHDLDQALVKAKAENKMVFIDFYTSWCGPCKTLDKEVFPEEKVGSFFNAKFINCKIQCDDKGIGVKMGEKYKVNAYPTLMFLNGNGQMVHSAAGAPTAGGVIELAEVALNPEKNLMSLVKQWDAGRRDRDFVFRYFKQLKDAYRTDKASTDFSEFFNKLNDKDKVDKNTFELIKIVGAIPFSPLFNYLETNKERCYKTVGKKEIDDFISTKYLWYIQSIASRGSRPEYDKVMKEFQLKKYPYFDEYEMFYAPFLSYNSNKDIKAYMDLGTEFLAKYGEKNDAYTISLTMLLGNLTGRPNEGAAGITWIENLLKRNPDPKYLDAYFYILWRNYQLDKALIVGNQIRDLAVKGNKSTETIDAQMEMVKAIKRKK